MSDDHWQSLFKAWSSLPRPEGASPEPLAAIKAEVADVSGPILLLGMTPGLIDAGADLTAIDHGRALVRDLWPGNTAGRRAVVGDWLRLPFKPASFAACIGDGSLTSFAYPDRLQLLLEGVARCLRPDGRFACRVFLAPDAAETIAQVKSAALRAQIATFQILKFRLWMAIAAEAGSRNVAVAAISSVFESHFADRGELAAVTGWDRAEIDTIDVYRQSPATYGFPRKSEILGVIPHAFSNPRLVAYAHAQGMGTQWPILVMERR